MTDTTRVASPADPQSVTDAYDRIVGIWQRSRGATHAADLRERGLIDRLLAPLPLNGTVLDVGCGCGRPIAAYLVERGFRVKGLDGSIRMVELARLAVPGAIFVHGDMRVADPGGPFDAIIAWDSVFHLPRADHAAMFQRLWSWLRPGGRLLVSLGGSGGADFTSEMHGETFLYGGHEPVESLRMLEEAALRVEHWEVDDPSGRGHIAILAHRVLFFPKQVTPVPATV